MGTLILALVYGMFSLNVCSLYSTEIGLMLLHRRTGSCRFFILFYSFYDAAFCGMYGPGPACLGYGPGFIAANCSARPITHIYSCFGLAIWGLDGTEPNRVAHRK